MKQADADYAAHQGQELSRMEADLYRWHIEPQGRSLGDSYPLLHRSLEIQASRICAVIVAIDVYDDGRTGSCSATLTSSW